MTTDVVTGGMAKGQADGPSEKQREIVEDIRKLSRTMNEWLGERNDVTIVTAESLTGGGVSAALTAVPGTSSYFLGGIVAYSNPAKHELLGVPEDILKNPGAVSDPCARAMAEGARRAFDATFAVATTGLAGPGGETGRKPVGLVYIAVTGPDGTVSEEHRFSGDRRTITDCAIEAALTLLGSEVDGWLKRDGGRT
ncbi:MAG TPA: CinA family protein [Thermomicrobiales bacterium]|jgi:nicotinamide-nucleotide amidase|nr:CinA family protein [Thermomicrobiales bacterium]